MAPWPWTRNLQDRRSGAIALGTIGGEKACDALIPLLKSSSAEERDSAVAALGGAKCVRGYEPSVKALADENYAVSASTAMALDDIGDKRAVEPLLTMLNKDDTDTVKIGTVVSLGALGDKRVIPPLEKMLKSEKSENVRQQIEVSLRQLRQQ